MSFLKPVALNKELVQLIEWQLDAVKQIVEKLSIYNGVLLRGGTGLGKMYIKALAVKELIEKDVLKKQPDSVNPFPVLWLCPKSVKMQTQRVLKEVGIAHLVMLYSYGQIKNRDGTDTFLQYITEEKENELHIFPEWFSYMLPALIVCDECQVLKNPEALQSKVVRFCPSTVKTLLASATPFQRVADARTIIERLGVVTKYNALPCTRTTSMAILREIAYPKSPDQYSPSAVDRLRQTIEPYIVELKNVRFKYPTRTIQTVIKFRNVEQRKAYDDALDEYNREVAEGKKKGRSGSVSILVAIQKFKEKAAWLRHDEMGDRAIAMIAAGKQVIIGADYKSVLRAVWNYLVKVKGVDRDKICFIVGGQSEKERQAQIDKFQAGLADIMLLTTRSGGVGISLHHDRPFPSRPRYVIIPPTWSAIDLVQYIGRAHRLTSISPTIQEVLWYDDTIESEKVMPYVKNKTRCLAKAVTAKEQFITMFEKATEAEATEANDELNEALEESKTHEEEIDGISDDTDEITGEGLESVEEVELPTGYR